jgi:hypothetical protein
LTYPKKVTLRFPTLIDAPKQTIGWNMAALRKEHANMAATIVCRS